MLDSRQGLHERDCRAGPEPMLTTAGPLRGTGCPLRRMQHSLPRRQCKAPNVVPCTAESLPCLVICTHLTNSLLRAYYVPAIVLNMRDPEFQC